MTRVDLLRFLYLLEVGEQGWSSCCRGRRQSEACELSDSHIAMSTLSTQNNLKERECLE